jgi:hypothetical protein
MQWDESTQSDSPLLISGTASGYVVDAASLPGNFVLEMRRLRDMKNMLLLVRLQHSVHHLTCSCDILHLQTLNEYFCFLPVTNMATLRNLKFIWAANEVCLSTVAAKSTF